MLFTLDRQHFSESYSLSHGALKDYSDLPQGYLFARLSDERTLAPLRFTIKDNLDGLTWLPCLKASMG